MTEGEKRLDRIEQKIDQLVDAVSEVKVTMAENTRDIAHHIKRTDALEARVEQVDRDSKDGRYSFLKLLKDLSIVGGAVLLLAKLYTMAMH